MPRKEASRFLHELSEREHQIALEAREADAMADENGDVVA